MKKSKTEDTRREVGAALVKSIADEKYRGRRDSSMGKMFAAQVRRHEFRSSAPTERERPGVTFSALVHAGGQRHGESWSLAGQPG